MAAGYSRGIADPCSFYNSKTGVSVMVHGDDFLAVGLKSCTKHLEENSQAAYKVKVQVMGDETGECSEIRVLNRISRWTTTGCKIEAEPRHAERVVRELGFGLRRARDYQEARQRGSTSARRASTSRVLQLSTALPIIGQGGPPRAMDARLITYPWRQSLENNP